MTEPDFIAKAASLMVGKTIRSTELNHVRGLTITMDDKTIVHFPFAIDPGSRLTKLVKGWFPKRGETVTSIEWNKKALLIVTSGGATTFKQLSKNGDTSIDTFP